MAPPSPDEIRARLQQYGLQRDRLRATLARVTGLAETDLDALEHLESAGALTPTELADRLGLTSGGVTVLADRLERAGLVRRVRNPNDRRSVLIQLDPDAAKDAEPIDRYHADVTAAARKLSPEHRQAVADFLATVAAAAATATDSVRAHRRQAESP